MSRVLTGGALVWVVVMDVLLLVCWPVWAFQTMQQVVAPRSDMAALQQAEGLEHVVAAGAFAGVVGLLLTGAVPSGRSWLRRGAVLTALLYLSLMAVQGVAELSATSS